MKNLLFFCFVCILGSVHSQVDSTSIKLGDANMTIAVEKNGEKWNGKPKRYANKDKILGDHVHAHWTGLDVGVSMLMNTSGGTTFTNAPYLENDPAASWTFNINVFEHYFAISKHNFGFVTGIGFNASHFGFKRNSVLSFDYLNDTIMVSQDTLWNFSRNRLRVGYVQIPLLFQINTNADFKKNVHIAVGVLAGVRLGSDLKRKSVQGKDSYTYMERGSFFLNPFKLDGTLRVGYRNMGLFATYGLLPLFDTKITQQANVLSFGLSLTL